MSYAAHQSFIAPARTTPELGRLVFGVLTIELLYKATLIALTPFSGILLGDNGDAFSYGTTTTGLLMNLGAFGFLALWVLLVAYRQHHRGFLSLTGPLKTALPQFTRAFIAIALLFAANEAIPPWGYTGIAEMRDLWHWVALLPLALLALLVQTGAEELMYRGYIQQQIAARFAHPAAWLILPNILFAAAHYDSGLPIEPNAQYMLWTFCFGLAASDLTARSGTLGPAIGFHLANNAYAFLFFAEEGGPDSGLALWLFAPSDMVPPGADALFPPGLAIELFLIVLMWGAARIAIRR